MPFVMRLRRWPMLAAALLAGCGAITSFDGFSDKEGALDDAGATLPDASTGGDSSAGADGQADGAAPDGALPDSGDAGADVVTCDASISTGPKNGASAGNVSGGDPDWTSTSSALVADGVSSTVTLTSVSDKSDRLVVRDFNFGVPSNATIVGVTVEVTRAGVNHEDDQVRLVRWNGSGSPTYASGDRASGSWPTSLGPKTYTSSLGWGTFGGVALTPAVVNASDFGVAVRVAYGGSGDAGVASVDAIRASVSYCP